MGVSVETFLSDENMWFFLFSLKATSEYHLSWGTQSTGPKNGLKISIFHSYLIFVLKSPLSSNDLRSIGFGCIETVLVDFIYENNVHIVMTM